MTMTDVVLSVTVLALVLALALDAHQRGPSRERERHCFGETSGKRALRGTRSGASDADVRSGP